MMQLKPLLLAGERYRDLISLDNVIWLPDNPFIDERLAGHADLSLFYGQNGILFCQKHLKSTEFPCNINIIDIKQDKKYPNDVQFNACIVGNNVFLNEKYIAKEIIDFLSATGKKIINIKQGYAKCCILVIDDNSIITSDPGIHDAAILNGIESLKIKPGYIGLEGFDYGFIGGTAYELETDTFYFTGLIECHPDKSDIQHYFSDHGKKIKYMTDRAVFDIGAVTIM